MKFIPVLLMAASLAAQEPLAPKAPISPAAADPAF